MSTKRIREALEMLGRCVDAKAADAALEDLAKIEEAAKTLHAGATGGGWGQPGVHDAFDVIATIAKGAP